MSEADGATATNDDELLLGCYLRCERNFTIGYGERDYEEDTTGTANTLEQNDKGIQASYRVV